MFAKLALPAIALLLSVACAASRSPGTKGATAAAGSPFPDAEALTKLAAAPPPASSFYGQIKEVDTWTLQGPFPDSLAYVPHAYDAGWAKPFADAIVARPGAYLPSEAMYCTAREVGLFYLAHDAHPGLGLKEFIASRCGSPSAPPQIQTLSAKVDDKISDERLLQNWQQRLSDGVKTRLGSGNRYVGMWFGRKDGKAVLILTSAERLLFVEQTHPQPDAKGVVHLRGEVTGAFEKVRALVTRGAYGVSECTVDRAVRMPAFAIDCPTTASDKVAWIELAGFPTGRILGTPLMSLFVWPSGAAPVTFVRPRYAAGKAASTSEALASDLLTLLNETRAKAGLKPLKPAAEQSATATRVVPHYFAAIAGDLSPLVADTVALGLQAGWQVRGLVQTGRFASGLVSNAADVGDLLAAFLERPSGRDVLLAPNAALIAIGPLVAEDGKVLAALVSSYDLFDVQSHEQTALAVRLRLDQQRRANGKGPAGDLSRALPLVTNAASLLESGRVDEQQVMDDMMHTASASLTGRFYGWMAGASSLEAIQFPKELLTRGKIDVAVAVAFYRAAGQPWGHYVAFFLVMEPDVGEGV
ncbi:MAG: hypothetical protein HY903_12545 [Deltaproteobacteria bacterium]|nr:hypothetical protein [Deltaproteobacteria bacterium]